MGRPEPIFDNFKTVLAKYVKNIPSFPSTPPMMSLPADIALVPVAGFFNRLAYTTAVVSSSPQNMEALGQALVRCKSFGVYDSTIPGSDNCRIQIHQACFLTPLCRITAS